MDVLIQEALLATRHVSHAAIIRRKDGACKSRSDDFEITQDDYEKLDFAFNYPYEARASGQPLTFNNDQFRIVRADNAGVYGKNDKSGIVVVKTQIYYIVGLYEQNMHASVAAEAVERLGRL